MPGNEDRRDKDRREDQGDGHDRSGDLLHGLEGCSLRRKPLLYVPLHRLDHDDGIVHDQAYGEDEAEKGEGVDRKAEEREDREGADEGDRYGQGRDEVALHPWRNRKTTRMTRPKASRRVMTISLMPS